MLPDSLNAGSLLQFPAPSSHQQLISLPPTTLIVQAPFLDVGITHWQILRDKHLQWTPTIPPHLLEKEPASFNQGASGLCVHHQDHHLSFVPLGTPPSPANQPHRCIFTHLELLYFRGPRQKNHLQVVSCWSGGSQQELVSKMGTSFAN